MGTVSTELDLEWESSKRRPPSAYANGLHVDAAKSAHPIFGNGGDKMRVGFSLSYETTSESVSYRGTSLLFSFAIAVMMRFRAAARLTTSTSSSDLFNHSSQAPTASVVACGL